MAEISLQDLRKALENQQEQIAQGMSGGASPAALPSIQRAETKRAFRADEVLRMGARPGVPLDVQTGAPFSTRLKLSLAQTEEDRIRTVSRAFHGSRVEENDLGQLIVRDVFDPESSQVKDLLVDEKQVTGRDLADLTMAGIQTVSAVIALRKGKPITEGISKALGIGRLIPESAVGALGSQAAVAAGEAGLRASQGMAIDPADIARRRAAGTAAETLIGIPMGGAVNVAQALRNRRGHILAVEETTEGAKDILQRMGAEHGVEFDLTLGQATGSANINRAESIVEKTLFGGAVREKKKRVENSLRELLKKALQIEDQISPARTGEEAIATLRQFTEGAEKKLAFERMAAFERAVEQVTGILDNVAMPGKVLEVPDAVLAARNAVGAQKEAFDEFADFLNSKVGNPMITTRHFRDRMKQFAKDLPKRVDITEVASPLVTETGGEITSTVTSERIMRGFVPARIRAIVDDAAAAPDEMPLTQIRRMRTQINEAINEGEALSGITTHDLREISHALTQGLEQGTQDLADPVIREGLQTFNKFYRENIVRFQDPNIVAWLKDPAIVPGFGNVSLGRRLLQDPDFFLKTKEFLEDSPRFTGQVREMAPDQVPIGVPVAESTKAQIDMLRKSVLAEIYSDAASGPGMLDGAKLLDAFNRMPAKMARELVGSSHATLLSTSRHLGQVQGKIPVDEFENLLRQSNPSNRSLQRIIEAEKEVATLYRNNVIKRFLKGEISGSEIKPQEFVNRFMDDATEVELRQVMSMLSDNPGVVESIQRIRAQKLLADATPIRDSASLLNFRDPLQLADGKRLAKQLRDPAQREKLTAVLGSDTMNFLDSFAKAQALFVKGESQASGAGGIAGSFMILNILRTITNVPLIAKHKLMSFMLTSPGIRDTLVSSRPTASADWSAVRRSLIASEPFLAAMAADGLEWSAEKGLWGAGKIVDLINESDGEAQPERMSIEELKRELSRPQPQPANP